MPKAIVLGAGISGIAASKLLIKNEIEVLLFDNNPKVSIDKIKKSIYGKTKFRVVLENLNDQDVINTFVWMISELSKSVGVTQRISEYGAKEEDIEMLAEKAMEDPCKPGNPREVSKEDFINLYRQAM